jgi:hypothetical protein
MKILLDAKMISVVDKIIHDAPDDYQWHQSPSGFWSTRWVGGVLYEFQSWSNGLRCALIWHKGQVKFFSIPWQEWCKMLPPCPF